MESAGVLGLLQYPARSHGLARWLLSLKVPLHFTEKFIEAGFDCLATVQSISESHLIVFGLNPVQVRRILLQLGKVE
jgi:hypothetical protein